MEKKLGLSALTALVLSSMLGAGVFSLPQNMAAVASPAALLIGWGITGAGILLLAFAMLILTRIRPELDGGIFTYAREGFGELIGFCSAWGYWLCAVIANVSYLVIVFSALSFFTDTPELRLFGDGNTWQSIVGASALLWIVHFLILRGVQTAASINLVATLAKLLPLGLFCCAGDDDVQTGYLQARLHRTCTWRTCLGTGEKHHADHPVGFHWCGRCRGCFCACA